MSWRAETSAFIMPDTLLVDFGLPPGERLAVADGYWVYLGALDEGEHVIHFRMELTEGPFAGVPFLLKDLYTFRRGRPCGNGSRWFANYVSPFDDAMVARWQAAGLVVVGKSATL